MIIHQWPYKIFSKQVTMKRCRMTILRQTTLVYWPINGSQGWIHAWMGTVSVSGFQASTSACSFGNTSCSMTCVNIHAGIRFFHASSTATIASQTRTFQILSISTVYTSTAFDYSNTTHSGGRDSRQSVLLVKGKKSTSVVQVINKLSKCSWCRQTNELYTINSIIAVIWLVEASIWQTVQWVSDCLMYAASMIPASVTVTITCHQWQADVTYTTLEWTRGHILETSWENLRKISYLKKITGKYRAKHYLELRNNNPIIIAIDTLIFVSCMTLLCDDVDKLWISK